MKHKTFFWFILPSLAAMLLFIAMPLVSVTIQSLFVEHDQVLVEVENCTPFKCESSVAVDQDATAALREERPLGQFNGLGTYTNRSHLAFAEVREAWNASGSLYEFGAQLMNLPFYKALAFTITYTAVVTPFVIVLGLAIALGVNALPQLVKGPTIFCSLLPMIVTPLIGSLILFWMVDADGIMGAALQRIFDDDQLSLKSVPFADMDHADRLRHLAFCPRSASSCSMPGCKPCRKKRWKPLRSTAPRDGSACVTWWCPT